MAYKYENFRDELFMDEGQRRLLRIRENVMELLATAGACTMQAAITKECGDPWKNMACVDRLVEIGEIRELPQSPEPFAQFRVFVPTKR